MSNHKTLPHESATGFAGSGYGYEVGLTKREYFAACALQGFAAQGGEKISDYAILAVAAADALINELNRPPDAGQQEKQDEIR